MKLHLPKVLFTALLACMVTPTMAEDLDVPAATNYTCEGTSTYGTITLHDGSTLTFNAANSGGIVTAESVVLEGAESGVITIGEFQNGQSGTLNAKITGSTGTLKFSSKYNNGNFKGWQENDFTAAVKIIRTSQWSNDSATLTFNAESRLTEGGTIKAWGNTSNAVTLSNDQSTGLTVAFTNLTADQNYTIANNITVEGRGATTLSFDNGHITLAGNLTVNSALTLNATQGITYTAERLDIGADSTISGGLTVGANSTLSVADGKTLTLSGTVNKLVSPNLARERGSNGTGGSVTVKLAEGGGSIVGSEGVVWKISGGDAVFDADAKTLTRNMSDWYYFYNLTGASFGDKGSATTVVVDTQNAQEALAMGNGNYGNIKLIIQSGLVTTERHNGVGCITGDIVINGGGTLRVTGDGQDAFGYGDTYTKSITLTGNAGTPAEDGTVTPSYATLDFDLKESKNSVTMKSALILNGYTKITGEKGFNTLGGTITVNGTDNSIDCIDLREGVTMKINADAEVSVEKFTINSNAGTKVLTLTGAGTLNITGQSTLKGLNMSGTVNVNANTSINGTLTIKAGATLNVDSILKAGTYSNFGVMVMKEKGMLDLGTTTTDGATFNVGAVTHSGSLITSADIKNYIYRLGRREATYSNGVITLSGTLASLTWNGTEENHVWNKGKDNTVWKNSDNTSNYFYDYDNVTFAENSEGVSHNVQVGESVHASAVTVGGTYTFTVADGASINAESILADQSGNLTINGNVTVSGSISTTNGGIVNIESGNVTVKRLMLHNARSNAAEQMTISGGVVNVTSDYNALTSNDDTNAGILLGHWPGANSDERALTLSGGVLNALNTVTAVGWDSQAHLKISGGEANLYLLGINYKRNKGGTVTLSGGRLNIGAGGVLADNATTMTISGGTLGTLTTNEWTLDSDVTLSTSGNFTIDTEKRTASDKGVSTGSGEGGSIAIAGVISGTGKLIKAGVGTLVLSGANTYSGGTEVNAGTLEVRGNGTLGTGAISVGANGTLSLEGSVTISKTIVNDGTITFGANTSLTIADVNELAADGAVTYMDSVSKSTQNGYISASYYVVKGSGQVTGLDKVTLNGDEYALTETDGNKILSISGTSGDYYVNEGTVIYGDEGNSAALDSTTGIVLNGGSLDMKQGLNANATNGIMLRQDATVTLDEATVELNRSSLTMNDHTLTLDGSGCYNIGDGTSAGEFSLADTWIGTVKLESGTLGSITHKQSNLNITKVGSGTAYINGTHATDISKLDIQEGTVELNAGNTGYYFDSVTIGTSATLKLKGVGIWLKKNSNNQNTQVTMKGESSLILDCCKAYGAVTTINTDITVDAEESYVSIKGSIYGNGVELAGKVSGTGELRFMNGSGTNKFTVSADISGALDVKLDKKDSCLYLSGNNTYTGATTVTAGTLEVRGNGTLGTGAISVGASGTLAFNGTGKEIAAGASITFAEGATLAVTGGSLTLGKEITVTRQASNGNIHLGSMVDSTKVSGTLKLGTGGSLTYDNLTITGVNGVESSISAAGGIELSLFQADLSASNIKISDATAGREINAAFTNVAYENTAGGAVMQGSDKTFSSLSLAGDLTVDTNVTINSDTSLHNVTIKGNKELMVTGSTTLSGTTRSITIENGATFTTGNETITKLTEDTATTISGTGIVSVATAGITYTNADITVGTSDTLTTAATLAGSRLTVTGGGSVKTEVAQDSTNSFDASQGNVTVDTGSAAIAKVENLTVGAGKEATFATESGAAAGVVVSGTADVAGTVSADVTVRSGNAEAPATFTANNGAEVGGSLTVTESGKLTIAGGAVADNALTVTGTMQLTANSVLDFTELSITKQKETQTFTIAKAEEFSIDAATRVLGLDNLSWTLTNNAGAELLSSTTSSGGTNPAAPAMFSMRNATDTLTLTVLGTDTPGTLTKTSVVDGGVSVEGTNITLTVADSLAGVTGNFNVIVGENAWEAIVAGMADNGGIYQNANVTLTDGTNTFDWTTATGPVTLNGYAGTDTKGEYFVAYIPEPATATLSLLALAALAARRRRK